MAQQNGIRHFAKRGIISPLPKYLCPTAFVHNSLLGDKPVLLPYVQVIQEVETKEDVY